MSKPKTDNLSRRIGTILPATISAAQSVIANASFSQEANLRPIFVREIGGLAARILDPSEATDGEITHACARWFDQRVTGEGANQRILGWSAEEALRDVLDMIEEQSEYAGMIEPRVRIRRLLQEVEDIRSFFLPMQWISELERASSAVAVAGIEDPMVGGQGDLARSEIAKARAVVVERIKSGN